MVVGIKVISEDVRNATVKHTNTSYFTMVAKNDEGRPTKVPGLILENREEVRRFLESIKRKELKNNYGDELDNARTSLSVETDLHKLEGERCQLNLSL
jgi:acyl-CoA hydrolase